MNLKEHLTVQERVEIVARRFTDCQYEFANWAQLNVALDDFVKPTICYILPPSGTLTPRYGAATFKDAPTSQIAFIIPSNFDFDGKENDDKVELMKILACMFIRAINESGLFEPIDEVELPYTVPYDIADDNLTGIILEMPLKITSGFCDYPSLFGFE